MKTIKFFLLLVLTWLGISAHAQKEVYTSFDKSTGTLTYYYDDRREERTSAGETTEIYDPVNDPDKSRFEDYCKDVKKAIIDVSMKDVGLTSMRSMFYGHTHKTIEETDANLTITTHHHYLSAMKEIEGLENLNTANVTDMQDMFFGCSSLKSLDLSSFNTDNVTDMNYMFYGCSQIT